MKSIFRKQNQEGPIEGSVKITSKDTLVSETEGCLDSINAESFSRQQLEKLIKNLEKKKVENQAISSSVNSGVVLGLQEAIDAIRGLLND